MDNSNPKPPLTDSAEGPTKDQSKPESFRDRLKDLAESSSLHGIPKIASSRQITVKVLWCLLFLATTSVVIYQLINLFKTYYSYPIQTSVSLMFDAIPYPAISICNMNPVKASKLDKTEQLKKLINTVPEDEFRRKRRDVRRNIPKDEFTYGIENAADEIVETEIQNFLLNYENYLEEKDDTKSDLLGWFNYEDTVPPQTSDEASEEGYVIKPSRVEEKVADQPFAQDPSLIENDRRHKRGVSSIGSSILPASSSMPSSSNSYYSSSYYPWYDSNYYGNYFDNIDSVDWNNIYHQLTTKKNAWEQRVEDVKSVFRNTSLKLREEIGHQKEDLFVSITFAGQTQEVSRLRNFSSNDYGNCYTITGPRYIAWRTGAANGFKLTINLEVDEYIKNFTTGYGLRVVFHEPGTQPLPSQDGLTLSPGTETSIGLRTVKISRLGQPHGNCDKGETFRKQYKIKYSLAACYEFCRIRATADVCNCLLPDAPDGISFNSTFIPICNSTSSSEDHKCVFDLNVKFNEGGYDCECREPCKELVYTETMSSRYWPTDEYLDILLSEICEKKNLSITWVNICGKVNNKSLDYFDVERIRTNFVRALIYFEDLNYEQISEEPLYEGVRFLSDIGGTLGLFLGASVLSLVEVLQVILEIILHLINKFSSRGTSKVSSVNN